MVLKIQKKVLAFWAFFKITVKYQIEIKTYNKKCKRKSTIWVNIMVKSRIGLKYIWKALAL